MTNFDLFQQKITKHLKTTKHLRNTNHSKIT